jgi:tellurite resistance protein TehA-like permease
MQVQSRISNGIKKFFPGYFALVMATGIISLAADSLQYDFVSHFFFWISNILYVILVLVFIVRIIVYFPEFRNDLSAHAKGAGFLTLVAATSILGSQYTLLFQNYYVASVLFVISCILWVLFIFSFVFLVIIQQEKPPLEKAENGTWLLLVVSTQSLSVLATSISQHVIAPTEMILFTSLCLYLLGFIFYSIFITLIFYRLIFVRVTPQEFEPPYWIDMGAAAITTLAGMNLVQQLPESFFDFIPFLKTAALLSWAVGTWWIPVVCMLEIWRHRYVAWSYQPAYWSLVFPLGMYSMSTGKIAHILHFSFLTSISKVFIIIAITAWIITFISMIINFWKSGPPGDAQDPPAIIGLGRNKASAS